MRIKFYTRNCTSQNFMYSSHIIHTILNSSNLSLKTKKTKPCKYSLLLHFVIEENMHNNRRRNVFWCEKDTFFRLNYINLTPLLSFTSWSFNSLFCHRPKKYFFYYYVFSNPFKCCRLMLTCMKYACVIRK